MSRPGDLKEKPLQAPFLWEDWAILAGMALAIVWIAIRSRTYSKSVSDFLAAGRTARRYLLTVTSGATGHAAIRIIGAFEMIYKVGFSTSWWAFLMPVGIVFHLTGFVVYRFRETKALTLAQFLEIRYSRRLRIFVGVLMFVSGVVNMGVFPAIGARFFIYFCGLPDSFRLAGLNCSMFVTVMVLLTGLALFLTLGGQVTLLLTDFFEGITTNVAFLLVLAFLFWKFDWGTITSSLASAPADKSMLNPFHTKDVADFNLSYVVITIFTAIYSTMAWQGNQGFNSAPASAHEARMGKMWGQWREMTFNVMLLLLPIAAFVVMHQPAFHAQAEEVQAKLAQIPNEHVRVQMTVPIALRQILPTGLKGILCAILFCGFVGNLDMYLHSWGSIFVQDVVLPFRKNPLTLAAHIRLLRWGIFGVAAFIVLFSLLYEPTEFVLMFQIATGAIYLAGAGAIIIGGLYWSRGTIAGGWAAMVTGATVMSASVIIRQIEARLNIHILTQPNPQIVSVIGMGLSLFAYVLVSLLTCRQPFNLQRMLHRGVYADSSFSPQTAGPTRKTWLGRLGINDEFTTADKLLCLATVGWYVLLFLVAVGITVYCSWRTLSDNAWSRFWQINCYVGTILGAIMTVWIAWGGIKDLKYMLYLLRTVQRDHQDDGRVHTSNGDVEPEPTADPIKPLLPSAAEPVA